MDEITDGKWRAVSVPWAGDMAQKLAAAFEGDIEQAEIVALSVQSGMAAVYAVQYEESPVGLFAFSLGDECEVLAAVGAARGDITGGFLPLLEKAAKANGARAMNIKTFRRGMMEKLGRQGYRAMFVSFYKAL
jgi:hypothetical protein